jgi:hypothetical protein
VSESDENGGVFVGANADTWGNKAVDRLYASRFSVQEVAGTCGHQVVLSGELIPTMQDYLDRGVPVEVVCDNCWVSPEIEANAVVVMTHEQYKQLCTFASKERVDEMIEELGVTLLKPGETHA